MRHVVAVLISLAFGSAVWVSHGEAKTSHHHATTIRIPTLVISERWSPVTQLKTPRGCLGPVNHDGTWHVYVFPAKACAKHIDRVEWIVFGWDGGPYGFENGYMLDSAVCPVNEAPVLQANRPGRRMTMACIPMGFGARRQLFTVKTR